MTLAEMPRARVKIAVSAKPGFLRSVRRAKRTSWSNCSSQTGNPDFAGFFFDAGDVSELAHGGVVGVFRGHAARKVVLRLSLDVLADVLVKSF